MNIFMMAYNKQYSKTITMKKFFQGRLIERYLFRKELPKRNSFRFHVIYRLLCHHSEMCIR